MSEKDTVEKVLLFLSLVERTDKPGESQWQADIGRTRFFLTDDSETVPTSPSQCWECEIVKKVCNKRIVKPLRLVFTKGETVQLDLHVEKDGDKSRLTATHYGMNVIFPNDPASNYFAGIQWICRMVGLKRDGEELVIQAKIEHGVEVDLRFRFERTAKGPKLQSRTWIGQSEVVFVPGRNGLEADNSDTRWKGFPERIVHRSGDDFVIIATRITEEIVSERTLRRRERKGTKVEVAKAT